LSTCGLAPDSVIVPKGVAGYSPEMFEPKKVTVAVTAPVPETRAWYVRTFRGAVFVVSIGDSGCVPFAVTPVKRVKICAMFAPMLKVRR
jgi:hypothetical protein